jgi:hypothetical protein
MKPENLHNFDETSFRIGCLASRIVFTQTDKQVYISDPNNQEIVTSIESISGVGKTTDPMMIMAGQVIKEKHFPNVTAHTKCKKSMLRRLHYSKILS